MMNLLVDAGNTSIKMAVSDGDTISPEVRCDESTFISAIDQLADLYGKFDVSAVSDVRGMGNELYAHLDKVSSKVVNVRGDIHLPIINKYGTPETLGPDRLCAAIGAKMLYPGENCVIVDFGTAITFDFLTEKGEFLGGNISLGLGTRFKSLHHFTGKLPLLKKVDDIDNIGTTTRSAIESGVILGTIFEIEGYIRAYSGYKFIFTGGDAIFFAEKLKSPIFVVCNLVLMGLSQIAKTNAV